MNDSPKQPPDVQAILRAWLKEHNYDGLCNPELECGCGLDDFVPCNGSPMYGGIQADCQPAHRREVKPGEWRYVTDGWEPEEEEEWE